MVCFDDGNLPVRLAKQKAGQRLSAEGHMRRLKIQQPRASQIAPR
jgi:hypothetical protein